MHSDRRTFRRIEGTFRTFFGDRPLFRGPAWLAVALALVLAPNCSDAGYGAQSC